MSGPHVVVVTDAGGEAGLGHFKRCAALADALSARGVAVDALVCRAPGADLAAVAPRLCVTPLEWWGAPGRVLDAVAGRAVDAFVVDSYRADAPLLLDLRRVAPVVAIDDLAQSPLRVDVVVNGAWHAERLAYQAPHDAVLLLGPRHVLLGADFAADAAPRAPAVVGRVVLTLGGATPAAEVVEAARAVRRALPRAVIDVAGGLAAGELAPLTDMTVHRTVSSLRPLLAGADLAVTAGGMTLYECLATATPTVALCLADNQRPNIEHLGAADLIVPAERGTLASTVSRVAADRGLRERLGAGGRRAIDGRGAERVADAIVTLVRRREPARTAR